MSKRLNKRQVMSVLATCVSLTACAGAMSGDVATRNGSLQAEAASKKPLSSATEVQHRAAGEGKNYEWGKDHIFVKLSSAETGGALTLVQDNLKPGFDLGLHLHRTHSEIFYILDGSIDFTIGKKPVTAVAGSVVYVPAGTPHAAKSSTGGQMLMFYAPGGFDEMLTEIDNASWLQNLNPFATARRNEKYDMHKLSDGKQLVPDGPVSRYLAPGEGEERQTSTGNSVVKLSSEDTEKLAVVIEETLQPGASREARLVKGEIEILYILDGNVEFKSGNEMQSASVGATIFFPAGIPPKVRSARGAKLLVFRTPAAAS